MSEVAGSTGAVAVDTNGSVESSLARIISGTKRSITKVVVDQDTHKKPRSSDSSSNSMGGDVIRKFVATTPQPDTSSLITRPQPQFATRPQQVAPKQRVETSTSAPILVIQPQPTLSRDTSPHPQPSKRISMSPAGAYASQPRVPALAAGAKNAVETSAPKINPPAPLSSSLSSDDTLPETQQQPWTTSDDNYSEGDLKIFKDELSWQMRLDRVARFLQMLVPVFVFVSVMAFPVSKRPNRPQQLQHPSGSFWRSWWGSERVGKMDGTSTLTTGAVPKGPMPLTLRDVLMDEATGFHLAMAPAFFGFYGYFGALAAWFDLMEENVSLPIKSVAGASAGAMAAILLAAGIPPQTAADFCAGMTVRHFADFPGFGAVFRGNKFERIMHDFLQVSPATVVLNMEDAILPVAVTAFDLQTMKGQILQTGSMARAARASATFPGLFQPVGWDDGKNDYILIDGGIADTAGLLGLTRTMLSRTGRETGERKIERVINLCVGSFLTSPPPGPSSLPGNPEVISISLRGLPQPGPWAMKNGPKAFEEARKAMTAALDVPLKAVVQRRGKKKGDDESENEIHYELVVAA